MTTARVLTPAGRGAIAVVEVVGPDATAWVDRRFAALNGRALAEQPIGAIRFGRWRRDDQSAGEELVVVRTAPDRIEVHCHGGVAASRAILNALQTEGAQPLVEAGGPLRDQARTALTEAPTERTAAILLDQHNGALERAIEAILTATKQGDHPAAEAGLRELLSHHRLGAHLTTPWRVVLAGEPNVGKSSLINALVGYDRALVYDQPGTTRDVVTAATAIDGWPVTLADTAGIRETDDQLEAAGVDLARSVLARADVVVVVREAATYEAGAAARAALLAHAAPDAAVVDVANKTDRLAAGQKPPAGPIATSAPAGEGIDTLVAAIGAALRVDAPAPGTAVPFAARQFETLRQALAAEPEARERLLRALLAGERP